MNLVTKSFIRLTWLENLLLYCIIIFQTEMTFSQDPHIDCYMVLMFTDSLSGII